MPYTDDYDEAWKQEYSILYYEILPVKEDTET